MPEPPTPRVTAIARDGRASLDCRSDQRFPSSLLSMSIAPRAIARPLRERRRRLPPASGASPLLDPGGAPPLVARLGAAPPLTRPKEPPSPLKPNPLRVRGVFIAAELGLAELDGIVGLGLSIVIRTPELVLYIYINIYYIFIYTHTYI